MFSSINIYSRSVSDDNLLKYVISYSHDTEKLIKHIYVRLADWLLFRVLFIYYVEYS